MPELVRVDANSVTASGPQNWVKGQLSAKLQNFQYNYQINLFHQEIVDLL